MSQYKEALLYIQNKHEQLVNWYVKLKDSKQLFLFVYLLNSLPIWSPLIFFFYCLHKVSLQSCNFYSWSLIHYVKAVYIPLSGLSTISCFHCYDITGKSWTPWHCLNLRIMIFMGLTFIKSEATSLYTTIVLISSLNLLAIYFLVGEFFGRL